MYEFTGVLCIIWYVSILFFFLCLLSQSITQELLPDRPLQLSSYNKSSKYCDDTVGNLLTATEHSFITTWSNEKQTSSLTRQEYS